MKELFENGVNALRDVIEHLDSEDFEEEIETLASAIEVLEDLVEHSK